MYINACRDIYLYIALQSFHIVNFRVGRLYIYMYIYIYIYGSLVRISTRAAETRRWPTSSRESLSLPVSLSLSVSKNKKKIP